MDFLKSNVIIITVTIGILGLLLAFINYMRNRRIDKDNATLKEESKRKEFEENDKTKKSEIEALKKSKNANLPKFTKGETSFTFVETTIEHYLHNFGKTANNFSLVPIDEDTCYISIEPRGKKVFNNFDMITVTLKAKNGIERNKLKYQYELHYEDILGHRYKQIIIGTDMGGFNITDPIEIE
jgi:hypothetical protein